MSVSEYQTLAELKEIRANKTLSNDMEVKITLITHDTKMLDLAKFAPDTLFEVIIKPSQEYGA